MVEFTKECMVAGRNYRTTFPTTTAIYSFLNSTILERLYKSSILNKLTPNFQISQNSICSFFYMSPVLTKSKFRNSCQSLMVGNSLFLESIPVITAEQTIQNFFCFGIIQAKV